jgi:Fur family transcriptional regulator, ferric uptake regulator
MGAHAFDTAGWKQRLRDAGMRVTVTRLGVLKVLHDSPVPLSAQEIFEKIAEQGGDRVTVYRTLNSLEEATLLHRMDPGDRVWRYGILQKDHHHHAHFVCDDCGEVRCLEDATVSINFNEKAGKPGVGAPAKLKVTQQDVYLHGVCEKCDESHARPAKGAGAKPGGKR